MNAGRGVGGWRSLTIFSKSFLNFPFKQCNQNVFFNDLFPKNPVLKEDIDSSNVTTGSNFQTFQTSFKHAFPQSFAFRYPHSILCQTSRLEYSIPKLQMLKCIFNGIFTRGGSNLLLRSYEL